VIVVDVGSEEFDVAPAGLVAAGVGDARRHYIGVDRSGGLDYRREVVSLGGCHDPYHSTNIIDDKSVISTPA
jgi:hypothetical protein